VLVAGGAFESDGLVVVPLWLESGSATVSALQFTAQYRPEKLRLERIEASAALEGSGKQFQWREQDLGGPREARVILAGLNSDPIPEGVVGYLVFAGRIGSEGSGLALTELTGSDAEGRAVAVRGATEETSAGPGRLAVHAEAAGDHTLLFVQGQFLKPVDLYCRAIRGGAQKGMAEHLLARAVTGLFQRSWEISQVAADRLLVLAVRSGAAPADDGAVVCAASATLQPGIGRGAPDRTRTSSRRDGAALIPER
jgi:hypothetical protein